MARSYSTLSLVTVPQLSAPNAFTLGTRLVTTAEVHRARLNPALIKVVERLNTAVEALRTSRRLQREIDDLASGSALRADVRVDAACAGFHGFLQGWARLPVPGCGAEKAALAQRLLDVLFPRGLSFTQAPFVTEWAEVQTLLDRVDQPAHAALTRELGGAIFVEAIREAFVAYGEALQITKRRAELKASARVREPLDALVEALRSYVLRVSAHADAGDDAGDPDARALAEALLAPLVDWKTSGGRKKGDAADAPGDEAPGDEVPAGE
jgi:hypothetical protein